MNNVRILRVVLSLSLIVWLGVLPASANSLLLWDQSSALERGYRTGYSDGYNSGYKDIAEQAARDYRTKEEYQRADRSYNESWGPLEDYRDGYQQGFAAGYQAGYDRRPFDSSTPSGLQRRESIDEANDQENADDYSGNSTATSAGSLFIPRDAILLIELESSLSTDASQRGDPFRARVLEPGEYQGAVVTGRVTRVKRPGKVKGVAELQLTFDQIRLSDDRTTNFNADVIEVMYTSTDGVGSIDPEGGVRGKDSTKDDVTRVGAATGVGAVIGAIFGGGKGAAIGAAIGGAAGAGSVVTQRGKEVRLARGQQLKIRTATDTRIQ